MNAHPNGNFVILRSAPTALEAPEVEHVAKPPLVVGDLLTRVNPAKSFKILHPNPGQCEGSCKTLQDPAPKP
eukprot:1995578-Pyramimonas_sp.AAC.1